MIMRDMQGMLRRRWIIVALIAVATIAASWQLLSSSGVYTTRTTIAFTLPTGAALDEGGSAEPGIITFAATVASEADQNITRVRYSDADARPYGIGVREGVFVGVPDVGGQWSVSYRLAEVAIDIVGTTREWVREQQELTIDRVFAAADAQQKAIGIDVDARVQYEVEPLSMDIEHVAPSPGMQLLALIALGAAGAILSGLVLTWRYDRGSDVPHRGQGRAGIDQLRARRSVVRTVRATEGAANV
ncbi:hypothetical protein [Microbacterium sp. nov. GSS16]|uniref:hypothetical protein n=1 Tax=Microbacterium sp. nov. GSS16 TaxID=3019890 RepID=UPI0023057D64|nr:hypothetical protein [Microbacterium sp. nov. GSS16]WCD92913.1 hypothetical protein PGB26_01140 [Microbacterium sp. nov. GSS16]